MMDENPRAIPLLKGVDCFCCSVPLILLLKGEAGNNTPSNLFAQDDTITAVLRVARYYSCVASEHLWSLELVLVIWS